MKTRNLLLAGMLLCGSMGTVMAQEDCEKPRLTIACLSDIHAMGTMITPSSGLLSDITVRSSFKNALKRIKQEEDVDVMILGGDCQSNNTIKETNARQVRQVIAELSRATFAAGKPWDVLWVTGNHDYEVANYTSQKVSKLPKPYNAGDFYTFPMRDDIGVLTEENAFWETADNDTLGTMNLLAAYHYQLYGLDFVVLNCGKNFFANAWDYTYTAESAQWVREKLDEIYADDPDKTVFFAIHVPFPDSNSLNSGKGMNANNAYTILKEAFSTHPNLIMLYGHDHLYDSAITQRNTSQRVTRYDVKGEVINTFDATHYNSTLSANEDITLPDVEGRLSYGNFHLWNGYAQCYLGQTKNTYGPVDSPQEVTFINEGDSYGAVMNPGNIAYPLTMTTYFKRGNGSPLFLYEIADTSQALPHAVKVDRLKPNANYLVVSSTGDGYYAMSGSVYGDTLGMNRIAVDLDADSVVYKYPSSVKRLIWSFREGQDATDPALADAEGRVRGGVFVAYNPNSGKYLTIDSYNLGTAEGEGLPTNFTESLGKYKMYFRYNNTDYGLHLGTGGRFSRSPDGSMSMELFRVDDPSQMQPHAVRARRIKAGETYVIVASDDTAHWAMSGSVYKAGSSDQRLNRARINVDSDTLVYLYPNARPLLWTLQEVPTEGSFFSAFMGSMRYYYNSIDNGDPTDLPGVVQALMVYVYDDRVVLQMKNYNGTGVMSGLPIVEVPTSYTSVRPVHFDETGVQAPQLLDSRVWSETNVYDLQGRRVALPGRGLYIKNGRKVIVK